MGDATALDLALLAVVGAVAGWINTIAGAGSLLLLPALIFTGLPADSANATNRLGILATTAAAIAGYHRAGLRIGRSEIVLTIAAMFGGAIGAYVATLLRPEHVRIAIVVALAVMLVLSLVPAREQEGQGSTATRQMPRPTAAMVLVFVAIGGYGGFLQAGLGIIVLLYLSLAHGVGLVASNVVKSTVTLALTVIALVVFAARGERIDLVRGGVLAVASAAGGLWGARTAVTRGDRFIRACVTIAVGLSIVKMIDDMG